MDLLTILPDTTEKTGWPWTTGTDPDIYGKGTWPKISIVTPSYNQGQYIEETIRSVLLQNYPSLEYIIIDGGSSDETVSIIKKYEKWITYWVSERDSGQPEAINKGIKLCTGEIFNWINSDDYLSEGALCHIGRQYQLTQFEMLAGSVYNFSGNSGDTATGNYHGIIKNTNLSLKNYFDGGLYFHQPGLWLKSGLIGKITIEESLHYCFDTKFLLELLELQPKVIYTDRILVNFRLHDQSKTIAVHDKFLEEFEALRLTYTQHHDPEIASAARRYLADRKWRKFLIDLQLSKTSKPSRILLAIRGIAAEPLTRLNRFTMGAIKNILFN